MAKRFVINLPQGLRQSRVGTLDLTAWEADPATEDYLRRHAIFELNRDLTGDYNTTFDPSVHLTDAFPCRSCDHTELPSDRYFRDAWEDNGTVVAVNMPKARLMHMDRIRQARNLELTRLDAPWMAALDQGNQILADQIAVKKQALRDIPQTFDLARYRTPTTLHAAWPADLPR